VNREASTIKEQKDKQITELKSLAEQSGESAQNNYEKKVSNHPVNLTAPNIMKDLHLFSSCSVQFTYIHHFVCIVLNTNTTHSS
jgi:hypothetical protein